ncbi:MAG: AAA family ATPase [Acetobacteraceae bacterium]|nr:AAA family ATPase [Acetobacteraceae bacterium]
MMGGLNPEQALRDAGATLSSPAARERAFGRLTVQTVAHALHAPARVHLLEGLLAPGEFSVWWGGAKCGKTFLLARLGYGLALGQGMWGRAAERCPVLYLAAEGASGFRHRVAALCAELGDATGAFHFIAQSADLFAADADVGHVIEAAKAVGARLVVVDTLARVMPGGNEDKAQDMGLVVANFDRIREEAGAHVAVVHHGLKNGGDLPRGSGALVGAADLVVAISRGDGGEGKAEVTHAKDDPSGDVFGFRLRPVDLPPDASGRPRPTCFADETGIGGACRAERSLTLRLQGWLRDLQDMFATPGAAALRAPVEGMKPVLTLTRDQVREGFRVRGRFEAGPDGALTGGDRQRLSAALNDLKDRGKVCLRGGLVWLP